MTAMEGSGTVSLNDAEGELILLNGRDDEKETCVFVNRADVIDFLHVEIKKMRSRITHRCWIRFLVRLNLAKMRSKIVLSNFISIYKEMLICLLQREATQRDVERERRQRMEAEARVREATAEAERARSRVHHLQRELAR